MSNNYTKEQLEKEVQPVQENKTSQLELAMQLAEEFIYFYNESGMAYVKVDGNVIPVNNNSFSGLLSKKFYEQYSRGLSSESRKNVIATLEAKAMCDGLCEAVYKRLANIDNVFYVNLARKDNKIVEITENGWSITICPDKVNFLTFKTMKSLPLPATDNADINLLNKYINCGEDDWQLLRGFMIGCLMHSPPYPILLLCGEAGTGKSTITKLIKRVIDPNIGEHTKTQRC